MGDTKALLEPLCGAGIPLFAETIRGARYVCATNNHAATCLVSDHPAPAGLPHIAMCTPTDAASLSRPVDLLALRAWLSERTTPPMEPCPRCDAARTVECSACRGRGWIAHDCDCDLCECEVACKNCKKGRVKCNCDDGMRPASAAMVGIGNQVFDAALAARYLAPLEGVATLDQWDDSDPLIVRAANGLALIMPMRVLSECVKEHFPEVVNG